MGDPVPGEHGEVARDQVFGVADLDGITITARQGPEERIEASGELARRGEDVRGIVPNSKIRVATRSW
jgi:hypothetical protein